MRFLVLSDLHLEFAPPELRGGPEFDAVILAGDIQSPGHRGIEWAGSEPHFAGKPVILVPGNHEYYGAVLQVEAASMHGAAARAGVHLLDAGSVVLDDPAGGRVRLLGCTLWTDFEFSEQSWPANPDDAMREAAAFMSDYRAIEWRADGGGARALRPQDVLERHRIDRAWLAEQLNVPFDGKTVVVSHHGPSGQSVAPRYRNDSLNGSFVSELPASFFEVPALWVHGHTHSSLDYRQGATRVLCNPRGYRRRDGAFENPHFDPHLVAVV